MRVLVVEDEVRLAVSLKKGLEEEGFRVDIVHDGRQGETEALVTDYDALVVDWRLPRQSGLNLIKHLRAAGLTVPILLLTALDGVEHRVEGLNAGADDYLTKPFAFEELVARLRALLRRSPFMNPGTTLQLGSLEYDPQRRRATLGGKALHLRPKEQLLLEMLIRHPHQVMSRAVLAETVWDNSLDVNSNLMDVTVSQLRGKLMEAQSERATVAIETVRGAGYRLIDLEAAVD